MTVQGKEALQIISVKRVGFGDRAAVLAEKVHCTQDRAIGNFAVQRGDGFIKILLVHFAQDFFTEVRGDLLHLARNGNIIVGQIGMAALGIGNTQVVALFREIEVMLLNDWIVFISEIKKYKDEQEAKQAALAKAKELNEFWSEREVDEEPEPKDDGDDADGGYGSL